MPATEWNQTMDRRPELVTEWAREVASRFDVRDPAGDLARLGVKLHVRTDPLRAAGKRIHGAWDPHLRRIELFGCEVDRDDTELVATLGHEIWHVTAEASNAVLRTDGFGSPAARDNDEATARRFSAAWVDSLGQTGVSACAAALRDQARSSARSTI